MAAATAGMMQSGWKAADAIALEGLGRWRQEGGGRERVREERKESWHTGEGREHQGSTNIWKRQLRQKKRGE